jgi:hypothetical protein
MHFDLQEKYKGEILEVKRKLNEKLRREIMVAKVKSQIRESSPIKRMKHYSMHGNGGSPMKEKSPARDRKAGQTMTEFKLNRLT